MKRHLITAVLAASLLSCGRLSPTEPHALLQPQCEQPAPLLGANSRAFPGRVIDEYVVQFRAGVNPHVESARLAKKYSFEIIGDVFTLVPGFAASMHEATVAKLRCESSVEAVQFSRTNIPPP